MIFKVKWSDLRVEFTKRTMVAPNPGETTPSKFYYEDELSFYAFLAKSVTMCSVIPKETLENPEAFKRENLVDATELLQNPLVLRTEGVITY